MQNKAGTVLAHAECCFLSTNVDLRWLMRAGNTHRLLTRMIWQLVHIASWPLMDGSQVTSQCKSATLDATVAYLSDTFEKE